MRHIVSSEPLAQNVLDSSAVAVLCGLEHAGLDLAVVDGRLRVWPVERLTAEHEHLIRLHRNELVALVRICDEGVQERLAAFKQQLRETPRGTTPDFLFRRGTPTPRLSASPAVQCCRSHGTAAAGAVRWRGGWPSGCRSRPIGRRRMTRRGWWREDSVLAAGRSAVVRWGTPGPRSRGRGAGHALGWSPKGRYFST